MAEFYVVPSVWRYKHVQFSPRHTDELHWNLSDPKSKCWVRTLIYRHLEFNLKSSALALMGWVNFLQWIYVGGDKISLWRHTPLLIHSQISPGEFLDAVCFHSKCKSFILTQGITCLCTLIPRGRRSHLFLSDNSKINSTFLQFMAG